MAGIIGKPYSQTTDKEGSAMHGPSAVNTHSTLGHMPDKSSNMHPDIKPARPGKGMHGPMLGG